MAAENTYAGARALNYFEEDKLLQALLSRLTPEKERAPLFQRLAALGADCGRLDALIQESHRDDRWPRLEPYDRWGKRADRIVYCAEQKAARDLAFSHDCLPPVPLYERMSKTYLLNQNGEGGITCPLAMTDGLIQILESAGSQEQKRRYIPLLNDPNVDTPFTGGQMVTERQGGSIVSENETRATKAADGSWRLTGLKWFCSNPGELWVTTAKPEGSDMVALFLVPRKKPDGSLNECRILRIKDLSGTRGKATAEIEYAGCYAEMIGRPAHGMALLMRVLGCSRIHTAGASLGFMRRAFVEAGLYADDRRILGKKLSQIPHAAATLERLEAAWTGCMLAFFKGLEAIEKDGREADVLVPLLKIQVSRAATDAVRDARLLFAGNGVLRDFSVLPRLAEDAIIQEIWEGTHPILAGHVLRGLRRPASRDAFLKLCGDSPDADELSLVLSALGPGDAEDRAPEGLRAASLAWNALVPALFKKEAGGALDPHKRFAKFSQLFPA